MLIIAATASLLLAACTAGHRPEAEVASPRRTPAPAPVSPSTPGRAGQPAARASTTGGLGSPLPDGFLPDAATFVSPTDGFVLGSAPCGLRRCPVLAATSTAGESWTQLAAPIGEDSLRFGTADVGYAFRPSLQVTDDGGRSWTPAGWPGEADGSVVATLRISAGEVYLVTQLTDVFTLWRAPVGSLDFTPTGASLTGPGTVDLSVSSPYPPLSGPSAVLLDRDPGAGLLTSVTGRRWTHGANPCPAAAPDPQAVSSVPGGIYLACQQLGGARRRFGTTILESFQPSNGPGWVWASTGIEPVAGTPIAGAVDALGVNGDGLRVFLGVSSPVASMLLHLGGPTVKLWLPVGPGRRVAPWRQIGFTDLTDGFALLDGDPASAEDAGAGMFLTRDSGRSWSRVDFSRARLPRRCGADGLSARWALLEPLNTDSVTTFILTNTTPAPCTLWGFPRLVLLDAAGARIDIPIQPTLTPYYVNSRPLVPVVLTGGGRASFFLSEPQVSFQPGTRCVRATEALVYPPGSSASLSLSVAVDDCAPFENVSQIVQGLQPPEIG